MERSLPYDGQLRRDDIGREAGIYAAYELALKCPGARVLVVDKGADIYRRQCPIVAEKTRTCIQCRPCATMCGFGGAGVTRGLAQAGASGVKAARVVAARLGA